MTTHVPIGEFARMTHLSVKTLHHYHDVGLLPPDAVDAATGYRRYALDQVERAQLIRRLRGLDMAVPAVRRVLDAADADDTATRDGIIRDHLDRMESELRRTQSVVVSLRAMLAPERPAAIEYRSVPAQRVLALRGVVARSDIMAWCDAAYGRLYGTAERLGARSVGPAGGTYSQDFFTEDAGGEVCTFIPIEPAQIDPIPMDAGMSITELPAGSFAIATHRGSFEDLDRSYGALGRQVAHLGIGLPHPIREHYLVGPDTAADPSDQLTEISWPIRPDRTDRTDPDLTHTEGNS